MITRETPTSSARTTSLTTPSTTPTTPCSSNRVWRIHGNTHRNLLGGRLADYKYYDMDDTIEAALALCAKELPAAGPATGRHWLPADPWPPPWLPTGPHPAAGTFPGIACIAASAAVTRQRPIDIRQRGHRYADVALAYQSRHGCLIPDNDRQTCPEIHGRLMWIVYFEVLTKAAGTFARRRPKQPTSPIRLRSHPRETHPIVIPIPAGKPREIKPTSDRGGKLLVESSGRYRKPFCASLETMATSRTSSPQNPAPPVLLQKITR